MTHRAALLALESAFPSWLVPGLLAAVFIALALPAQATPGAGIVATRAAPTDQPGSASQPAVTKAEEQKPDGRSETVSPASPRASMKRFLELTANGNWQEASAWLEGAEGAPVGARHSRRLKAVLDRHLWLTPESLSADPHGRLDDGLPQEFEELGRVSLASGSLPVLLVRQQDPDGVRWKFAASTVANIDAWYAALDGRWFFDHLPHWLQREGPQHLLWWQWLALPLVMLLALLIGRLLGWIARRALAPLVARISASWLELLRQSAGPVSLLWATAAARLLISGLGLHLPAERFLTTCLKTLVLVALVWLVLRSIDLAAQRLALSTWAAARPASKGMLPFGAQAAKISMTVLAAIAVLSEFGYPVASLLTGLGIGGLAVALAAQKTVENLFGSVSIGVDQPFRVGDVVRVEDAVLGTVEVIGLRSTRIRTADRTLVTIPNGKLADMRTETFAARDRIRLLATVGVRLGTSSAQMARIVGEIESFLRAHPAVHPDGVGAFFVGIGASSMDIEVLAWFQTTDFTEFKGHRQQALLRILEIIESAGTSVAIPATAVEMLRAPVAEKGP